MPAYMIAEIEVHDSETYSEYVNQVSEVVATHGGRHLVRGEPVIPLAGNWSPERVVVIEFPTLQHVQQCFSSEEYQRIAPLREASTTSRAIVVEANS